MASNRKKIYILAFSSLPGFSREDLKRQLPELQIISDLELIEISDNPAAENSPEKWLELALLISKHQDQAIGFVVVSGLDNILFASAAVSFMMAGLPCPIIFTGASGFFENDKKMEVRANLITSVQIAKSGTNEVCLMFGNRLVRANQAGFSSELSLNVFSAPEKATLGRIDFSVRLNELYKPFKSLKNKFSPDLYSQVQILSFPFDAGVDFDFSSPGALVINAKRQQQIPENIFKKISKLAATKPVMIYADDFSGKILVPENVILIKGMTFEAAIAKFMWALSQTKQTDKIKEVMAKNIAGEFFE